MTCFCFRPRTVKRDTAVTLPTLCWTLQPGPRFAPFPVTDWQREERRDKRSDSRALNRTSEAARQNQHRAQIHNRLCFCATYKESVTLKKLTEAGSLFWIYLRLFILNYVNWLCVCVSQPWVIELRGGTCCSVNKLWIPDGGIHYTADWTLNLCVFWGATWGAQWRWGPGLRPRRPGNYNLPGIKGKTWGDHTLVLATLNYLHWLFLFNVKYIEKYFFHIVGFIFI